MDRNLTAPALVRLMDLMKPLFARIELLDEAVDGCVHTKDDTGVLLLPVLVDGVQKTLRLEARLDDPTPGGDDPDLVDQRMDLLTGVYNRNTFCKKAAGRLAQGQGLVLTLLRVDDFDALLARHGRDTADKLLCAVAELCKRLCTPGGRDMVCRMGDCEFAICSMDKIGYDMEARMRRLPSPLVCPMNDGSEIAYTLSVACTGTDEVLSKVWPDLYALCNKRMRRIAAKGGNDVFPLACFSE